MRNFWWEFPKSPVLFARYSIIITVHLLKYSFLMFILNSFGKYPPGSLSLTELVSFRLTRTKFGKREVVSVLTAPSSALVRDPISSSSLIFRKHEDSTWRGNNLDVLWNGGFDPGWYGLCYSSRWTSGTTTTWLSFLTPVWKIGRCSQ